MSTVKVAVVAGGSVAREGMASILGRQAEFEIVGAYDSAGTMLDELVDVRPDIVVLEGNLPDIPGFLTCMHLLRRKPGTVPLVVVDDAVSAEACLAAGARGILPPSSSAVDLTSWVRRATHPAGTSSVHVAAGGPFSRARQLAVLRLAAKGRTNDQIARSLGLALGTVKADLRVVIRMLGAKSRANAVAVAIRRGLVS